MKRRKKSITLPQEVIDAFASITTNVDRDVYMENLRRVGWTLESIGQVNNLSRERVRQIVSSTPQLTTEHPIPDVPLMPTRAKAVYTEPAPETLARLLELQPLAQKVRSNSPDFRKESEEYSALIFHAHKTEGVSLYRLAKRLGVTHGALRFRLARYGYMPSPQGTSKVYKPINSQNRQLY
jgi:lambda repressor-like predicted transcriptional regulator